MTFSWSFFHGLCFGLEAAEYVDEADFLDPNAKMHPLWVFYLGCFRFIISF